MEKETIFAWLLIAGLVAGVLSVSAFADSATINAQVTIPASCGIVLSTASVNFGSVTTGTTSTEQSLSVNNTGSVSANVTLFGTTWISGANTMAVGQTRFSTTTGTYASKTALTGSNQTLVNGIANGGNTPLFLQMAVPLGQAAGTYNQNITVSTMC